MRPRNAVWLIALLIAAAIAPASALAGVGAHNVAVVVNPNDPGSLAVANAYIELRRIPPANVFYLPWNAGAARTNALQFRDRLLKPVVERIKQRKLSGHIKCIAWSTGFPYLVDCAPLFPGKQFPPQSRPIASLTGATYLHQFLLNSHEALFALNSNRYFAPTTDGQTTSQGFPWPAASTPAGAGAEAAAESPYLLSTALGVSHGRGNTAAEIIESLQRAKAADGTKPKGTIYYMTNQNVRSTARHDTFPAAVKELAAAGVNAEVLNGAVPLRKLDVAGLTTGSAQINLRSSDSKLLPGALVDNLTSAAAQFMNPVTPKSQTLVSEFIRNGAAGASGMVIEPFAIPQKFPSAALHVHYARGCTLAESFYLSVSGPWQMLVVGDPLCQPWAVAPDVSLEGLSDGDTIKERVVMTAAAKYSNGRNAARFELYIDGMRIQTSNQGGKLPFNTTWLADGWHELSIVAIDDTPLEGQGAWLGGFIAKNGRDALQLVPAATRVAESGTLSLKVSSTASAEAEIMHNNRRLGTVAAGNGQVDIAAKQLGKGRVQLYAQQAGEARLRSRPVTVEVY